MKGVSADATQLAGSIAIEPTTRVIAEINQNRYNTFDQAYVDANESTYYPVPASGAEFASKRFYKENFPVSSVVKPIRPQRTGISFFRQLSQNTATRPFNIIRGVTSMNSYAGSSTGTYGTKSVTTPPQYFYNSTEKYYTPSPRLYYVNPSMSYKNYTKNTDTTSTWPFTVDVRYLTSFWCNKISIGFDVTGGKPGTVDIALLLSNDTWSAEVSTNVIDSDGRVNLYRTSTTNGTLGTWTDTKPAFGDSYWNSGQDTISNAVYIKGIRITCDSTNAGPVTLIEVKPCLTADLTHRLMTWSWQANLSEQDSLHPIGTISANTGSIDFFNSIAETNSVPNTGVPKALSEYSRSLTSCTTAEFTRQFCEMQCFVSVSPGTTSNIPQFTAFADSWEDGADDKMSAKLIDLIGLLQEIEAPDFLIENAAVSQVLWRVLDMAGVGPVKIKKSSYEVLGAATAPTTPAEVVGGSIAPFYPEDVCKVAYTGQGQNLWEFIKSICADYRYAVYVDESGYINIATRGFLFDNSRGIDWTFYGQDSGSAPYADIDTFQAESKDPINSVTLKYISSNISSNSNVSADLGSGSVANVQRNTRVLWSPQKEIFLGKATLAQDLTASDVGYIGVFNGIFDLPAYWGQQFSGYVMIDLEIIKYEGLQFSFKEATKNSDILVYQTVKNIDDYNEIISRAIGQVSFTGKFMNLTRGQFGTIATNHSASATSIARSVTAGVVTTAGIVYDTPSPPTIGDSATISGMTVAAFNRNGTVTAKTLYKTATVKRAINNARNYTLYYGVNNFSVGDVVTISGFQNSNFNVQSATVIQASKTKFWLRTNVFTGSENIASGTATQKGSFTIANNNPGASGSSGASAGATWRVFGQGWSGSYQTMQQIDANTQRATSTLRVNNPSGVTGTLYPSIKSLNSPSYNHFFCSLNIKPVSTGVFGSIGGMVLFTGTGTSNNNGIYIQFKLISVAADLKSKKYELTVFKRGNSANTTLATSTITVANKYIGVFADLSAGTVSGSYKLKVSVNGKQSVEVGFSGSGLGSRADLGLFASGTSIVDFDYAGASKTSNTSESTYLGNLSRLISKILSSNFDASEDLGVELYRFDSAVRSVYYEDVTFANGPAVSVSWYPYLNEDSKVSNQLDVVEAINARPGEIAAAISNQSPWHARIFLVNLSESAVQTSGEKTAKYPLIYGEVYEAGGGQTVKKENLPSIQRMGSKKFEATLKWANNAASVEKIAQDILDISANGVKYIDLTCFSNHLLSVGDCVNISYDLLGYDKSDTFLVTGIDSSWENGLKNNIKLVLQNGI